MLTTCLRSASDLCCASIDGEGCMLRSTRITIAAQHKVAQLDCHNKHLISSYCDISFLRQKRASKAPQQ